MCGLLYVRRGGIVQCWGHVCNVCNVHCTSKTIHCTLYILQCTLYSVHSPHIAHFTTHTHQISRTAQHTAQSQHIAHIAHAAISTIAAFPYYGRFTHSSRVQPRPSLEHIPAAEQYNNSLVTQYTDYCVISQIHIAPLCSRD